MTRLEAMERYLKPFIAERIKEKIQSVKNEKDESLGQVMIKLLSESARKQQTSNWVPAYMAVFHLNSSLFTGSYDYQISLMNEQMYLDGEQIEADWRPDLIYTDLEREADFIRAELMKKFVRITDHEISYLVRQLIKEYKKVTEVLVGKSLSLIIKEHTFEELKKKEPFVFIYGDYMGEIKQILKYEGGSSNVR